jgi:hypothetical protein
MVIAIGILLDVKLTPVTKRFARRFGERPGSFPHEAQERKRFAAKVGDEQRSRE